MVTDNSGGGYGRSVVVQGWCVNSEGAEPVHIVTITDGVGRVRIRVRDADEVRRVGEGILNALRCSSWVDVPDCLEYHVG